MSDTQQDNGQYVFDAGPVMVQVTRDGRLLTLDVTSRAMILLGERYPKQFGECVRDGLLGDV